MSSVLMPAHRVGRRVSLSRHSWALRRLPLSVRLGMAIVALFAVVAVVSVFWTPYPPLAPATGAFLAAPSWSHLFGTDAVGADVFSRALAATHTDVGITAAVISLAVIVGTVWGSVVGFYGGIFDALSMRLLQVMNSFPALLLVMLVIAAYGAQHLERHPRCGGDPPSRLRTPCAWPRSRRKRIGSSPRQRG